MKPEARKQEKHKWRSSLKRCFFGLPMSVLALIISAVALFLAIYFGLSSTSHSTSQESSPHKETACVDCAQILSDFLDQTSQNVHIRSVNTRSDSVDKECCVSDSLKISKFIETIQNLYQSDINAQADTYPEVTKPTGPIIVHKGLTSLAKLNGRCTRNPEIQNGNFMLVNFNLNQKKDVEVVKHIRVTNDGLEIIFSGIYYVYSSFKYQSSKGKFKDLQTLHQFVYRERRQRCDCLLKTTHTVCQDCQDSKDTAFTGGVFHLRQGDILRVISSEQDTLQFNNEDSYLGALMVTAQ
ncbi:tumor necrosis factor ligand superfamily member 6 [Biomphalaria pfeifferi]|uniref:Tumor necrosis factor ligand superfamily member 6 n=1 Tax=Biomphalaria pfeifferi TaxID=112525 RepID=A0AAD8AV71_BIOPF|nr:tumor necrosis factor ligand superfamily member 6 [Biomphalaria pfeifferi]